MKTQTWNEATRNSFSEWLLGISPAETIHDQGKQSKTYVESKQKHGTLTLVLAVDCYCASSSSCAGAVELDHGLILSLPRVWKVRCQIRTFWVLTNRGIIRRLRRCIISSRPLADRRLPLCRPIVLSSLDRVGSLMLNLIRPYVTRFAKKIVLDTIGSDQVWFPYELDEPIVIAYYLCSDWSNVMEHFKL